ncbi:MAG TPA: helix-hairpin-helix domain-containing protein [Gemmatimonadota bacterium]|nr:helix-hairpin-helix domain-containing protein [Gemmatimonadota bacterium]
MAPTVGLMTWLEGRLTPSERQLLAGVAAAWLFGIVAGWIGWPEGLVEWCERRLHPPLPTPEALAGILPPGDPRPALYAAGLAARRERELATGAPTKIDPNTADRAAWDRLPGIGPRTAEAILEHRAARGAFRSPEDLLEVRGIGPVTLAKIRPWLGWPDGGAGADRPASAAGSGPPDLNAVDAVFLERLHGIGPELAKNILEERQRRRGFRAWPDVLETPGIGPAKLRVLQNATRLGEARPADAVEPVRRR